MITDKQVEAALDALKTTWRDVQIDGLLKSELLGVAPRAVEAAMAAMRAALEAAEAAATPTHRHVKSGGLYRVLHRGVMEANMSPVVIYRGENGRVWVRPAAEFFDGRFEPLPAPPKETPDAR